MNFSSHSDKRDLFLVFGLDARVQIKDTFFHNANSVIRKSLWEKVKFDEKITNIEDRIWASKILKLGWKIFYEPKASVYHYHGIHQDNDKSRLKNVINIINKNDFGYNQGSIKPSLLNIACVIPSKGDPKILKNDFLIKKTIQMALKSKYINKIYVSSDNQKTLNIAKKLNVGLIKRPKKYSSEKINLSNVQKFSLEQIENKFKILPDLFVHLEETFPFREQGLIDKMILNLLNSSNDTIVAAKEETGCMWKEENNEYIRLDDGYLPRKFKKKTYIGLHGLCCITYPEFIRKSKLEGKKVGLYKIEDHHSFIEIRETDKKLKKYSKLL
jgi:CMP-N-acetylneuraminic acid synthetase